MTHPIIKFDHDKLEQLRTAYRAAKAARNEVCNFDGYALAILSVEPLIKRVEEVLPPPPSGYYDPRARVAFQVYTGPERRRGRRMKLPPLQESALGAARATGALWYWRGGFWLCGEPDIWRKPTTGELEGGWIITASVRALEKRGLLKVNWKTEIGRRAIPVDRGALG